MLVKTLNFNNSFPSLLQLSLLRPAWERGKAGCPPIPSCLALFPTSLLTRLEVGKGPKGQGSPMGSGSGGGEGLEGVAFLSMAEVDICPWPFSNPTSVWPLETFSTFSFFLCWERSPGLWPGKGSATVWYYQPFFHFLKQGLIGLSLNALCSPSMLCAHAFLPASASRVAGMVGLSL